MALPSELKAEKNKLTTTSAWLVLLDIIIDASTHIRLVNNTEDITFQTYLYTSFPFEFMGISQNAAGTVETIDLRVSNVTTELYPYLRSSKGLVGKSVYIYIINSAHLDSDYADLTYKFTITDTSYDENYIYFKLSFQNPIFKKFPPYTYLSDWCNWDYGSVECGHSGNTCNRHLKSCRDRNNSSRFGGYLGLSRISFRVV